MDLSNPDSLFREISGICRAGANKHRIDAIVSQLHAAVVQSVDSDDQIIMDHVRKALEIARVMQREGR